MCETNVYIHYIVSIPDFLRGDLFQGYKTCSCPGLEGVVGNSLQLIGVEEEKCHLQWILVLE